MTANMLHPAAAPRPKTVIMTRCQLGRLGANVWIIGTPATKPLWLRNRLSAQSGQADVAHQTGLNEAQDIAAMMT
ncbi:hypothetical protein [Microvirga vignae]|uniref:hypothetical protein n=1 Tax=Microvirga vignae TaxID=1225564 RepID=UPI000A726B32|nr:hypothetical protein [Microvirga vignae]